MNPLLVPPAMALRALEDLHALARAAAVMADLVGRVEPEQVEFALRNLALLAQAADALSGIEQTLVDVEARALARADGLEARLAAIAELAERVEGGLPSIAGVLERIAALEARLASALEVVERLESDIVSVGRLGPSVDTLGVAAERLAATVGPLQGAAERLGKIADRVPRAGRSRS